MSSTSAPVGSIMWTDLTVPDAVAVRDFYTGVVGWIASPVEMEGYNDFCMAPPGQDKPAAGICHARGVNAELPPQWLPYITVADLDASLAKCVALGGRIVRPMPGAGGCGRFAVIQDPAGAYAALFQAESVSNDESSTPA